MKGVQSQVRKHVIYLFVPCIAIFQAMGMESGSVVGYRNADHKKGVHVNTLMGVGGDGTTLSKIVAAVAEGAELRFNDGTDWRYVCAQMGTDNKLHWFDVATGDCADDTNVPVGAAIQYEVPEESDVGLTFSGQVPERFLEGDMGPLFSDGPALNEIRLRPDEVARIMGHVPKSVTNRVVITNQPPSRFVVRMRDNTIRHVRFDYARMLIVDVQGEKEIVVGSEMIQRFEVETNASVAAALRLTASQVAELERAYVREFRQSKDLKDQQNAAKGVEAALFSLSALWKWLIGTVGAVLVGLIVTALWKKGVLGFGWVKSRVELAIIRYKGCRLYRKTIGARKVAGRA